MFKFLDLSNKATLKGYFCLKQNVKPSNTVFMNSIKLCAKALIVALKYSFMQDSPLQNNINVGI